MRSFLFFFFLIYGSVHVYAFLKTRSAIPLGYRWGVPLTLFMLLMILAPIIVRMTEVRGFELFARTMSYAGYFWLGFLFVFFSVSITIDAYRLLMYLAGLVAKVDIGKIIPSGRTLFIAAFSISVIANMYGYFEALNIRTERLTIKTSKLPEGTKPLKIAQVSDVHLGLIVREMRLKRILGKIKDESPDILIATGDLVDGQLDDLSKLEHLLKEVNPPLGKLAITGNHEYYAGLKQSLDFINKSGFKMLRNEATDVGGITIIGVDDAAGTQFGEKPKVSEKELLESLPPGRFTLFLKHRPDINKDSVGLFDLQLSGHTHKGQIFPFRLITRFPYPYVAGLYKLSERSRIYVSRGTGTWGPPVRVLAPPEVTIIEIEPEKKPA